MHKLAEIFLPKLILVVHVGRVNYKAVRKAFKTYCIISAELQYAPDQYIMIGKHKQDPKKLFKKADTILEEIAKAGNLYSLTYASLQTGDLDLWTIQPNNGSVGLGANKVVWPERYRRFCITGLSTALKSHQGSFQVRGLFDMGKDDTVWLGFSNSDESGCKFQQVSKGDMVYKAGEHGTESTIVSTGDAVIFCDRKPTLALLLISHPARLQSNICLVKDF